MFRKVNKKSSGGGFNTPVNLTATLNTVNATWVAPVDGMLSAYIRVAAASSSAGYWYLMDITLSAYVCTLYGTGGDYITNALPVVKGHTYKVTAFANASERSFIFYPFK